MDRSAQTHYYHQNALWSVEAVTHSTGAIAERYSYDAYGLPSTGSTNPWGTAHSVIGNPWMFTGRLFDEETGLYFYRARYYDPAKSRFLQRDPLEYGGAGNLYKFVDDSPTELVDPFGLQAMGNQPQGNTTAQQNAVEQARRTIRDTPCRTDLPRHRSSLRWSAGGQPVTRPRCRRFPSVPRNRFRLHECSRTCLIEP
jgi:RHS repeat-associated protein